MKFSATAVSGHWPALLKIVLLVLLLGYTAFLAWSAWALREAMVVQRELPVPPAAVVDSRAQLNPAAIATVLGLAAQNELVRSAEPLTLRASFVSSTGESRALLAGPDGERIYQVGESLPGGSVLRRVEITQVVLWRKGREELLPLQLAGERSLLAVKGEGPSPALKPSSLYFRPAADLRQSD
ncbi:type II secretion system protein N [Pseudomonas sp. H11T01]|uniref:type II secretion system protein N n=1 Tax=Pseudomonas sp. H11T01 TaxID=3402749 RepID=UPI003ACF2694